MESVDYKELLFKLVKNASPDDTKVDQSPLWTSFSGQKIIVGNDFIEKFSNQRIREKWREKYPNEPNSNAFLQFLEQLKQDDVFDQTFWKSLFYNIRDKQKVFLNYEEKVEIIRKVSSYCKVIA